MGLCKFNLFLLGLLCKGIVFCCHPSVACNHIILLMLQICVGLFKFNDLLSLRLRLHL
jgi:hypothetical protein